MRPPLCHKATTQLRAGVGFRRVAIVAVGLSVAALAGMTNLLGDYLSFVLTAVAFNAIAVLAVSMLAGYSGIWSLGHSAFVALGAYLAVNLPFYGFPIEAIVVAAALVSGLLGYAIGLSAGRFSTLHFGLLTLALSLIVVEIIGHWTAATGGDEGIKVPQIWSILARRHIAISSGTSVAVSLGTLAFLIADLIGKGTLGRRWLAVKSQRTAAQAIGLVPHRENALAFGISAAIASIAGVAMALAIGYVDQESFNLHTSVLMIVAAVVGGTGSFAGALLGAAFIVAVPELARDVPAIANYVFGTATIMILLFLRRGIVPSLARLLRSRRSKSEDPGNLVAVETTYPGITDLVRQLLPSAAAELTVENLGVSFAGLKALQNVSLTVAPGKTVGLIGPNGAGKTTLLNVLSGYVKPSTFKTLRIGDIDFAALPPFARIRNGFGRTFQHAELFEELTIRETLILVAEIAWKYPEKAATSLGEPALVAERIIQALGLQSAAERHPSELPFGIQKVADIARALAARPRMIAFDEPFSGLDNKEIGALRAILNGMKQAGVSILIIDHAVHEIMSIADQVTVLDFGRLLACGTPLEIQRNAEVQRAYFGETSGQLLAEHPSA